MNVRALGPANVAAAALTLGGTLLILAPQHTLSIVRVVLVTIAVGAGVYALAVHVPPTGWMSPFRWGSPFQGDDRKKVRDTASSELRRIRRRFSGRRQSVHGVGGLPPDTVRLLKPLLTIALDLDLEDPARTAASDRIQAVLAAEPASGFRSLLMGRPDERAVAETVHAILDDLDRIGVGPGEPSRFSNSSPRAMT